MGLGFFFVVLVSWLIDWGLFWCVWVYVCLVLGFGVFLPLVKKLLAMQGKLEFRSLIFLECTLHGNPASCLSRNCMVHPPLYWISGLQSQVFNRPKLIFHLS